MDKLPDTDTKEGRVKASAMLARLIGLTYCHDEITGDWFSPTGVLVYEEWQSHRGGFDVVPLDLYETRNMSIAWDVVNYAMLSKRISPSFSQWWYQVAAFTFPLLDSRLIQKCWLDKILKLANDAGLFKDETDTAAAVP